MGKRREGEGKIQRRTQTQTLLLVLARVKYTRVFNPRARLIYC